MNCDHVWVLRKSEMIEAYKDLETGKTKLKPSNAEFFHCYKCRKFNDELTWQYNNMKNNKTKLQQS